MPFPPEPRRPHRSAAHPDPPQSTERAGSPASRLSLITTIATAVVAVAALALSVFNYVDANSEPAVSMDLPALVRIATSHDNPKRYNLIIQPTFTLAKASTRTAVVDELALAIHPPPGSVGPPASPKLAFFEKIYTDSNGGERDTYASDAGPVVVAQGSGAAPIAEFYLENVEFMSGRWDFALTATLSNGTTLSSGGCVSVSHYAFNLLAAKGVRSARYYRDFVPPDTPYEPLDPTCYRG